MDGIFTELETLTWGRAFAVYYVVVSVGFLLWRLVFARGARRYLMESGAKSASEENLWQVFTSGLNPLLAAVLFPLLWPLVAVLQVLVRRVPADFPGSNRSQNNRTAFGAATPSELENLVGQVGEAACDLRPSGRVAVGGRKVEAVSRSGYIHQGERVLVVGCEGFRVVVGRGDAG